MPKFKVKNPFYWRGALGEVGAEIDVPASDVERLKAMNVLGEPVRAAPEKASAPEPAEKATKPAPKKKTKKG